MARYIFRRILQFIPVLIAISLFTFVLELEYVALQLCQRFRDECWEALPEGRKKKRR